MKKTIRVIELFDMISKGEEVPKRIRLFGDEFKIEDNGYYSVSTSNPLISYFGEDYLRAELNNEVEILDEEDEFEDIKEIFVWCRCNDEITNIMYGELKDKINQLIKNQKKIIERLNKEN